MILGKFGVTFLEIIGTGTVQSTTMNTGTGQAVHSRHTLLNSNKLLPSQYYGECSKDY